MQYNIISVQPKVLVDTSSKMSENIRVLSETYKEMQRLIESSIGWKGDDALAFSLQFKGLEEDFNSLFSLLDLYSTKLKECSKGYVEAQEALYTQGRGL